MDFGLLKRAARTPPGLNKDTRLISLVETEKRKALRQTVCRKRAERGEVRREKRNETREDREEKREKREGTREEGR